MNDDDRRYAVDFRIVRSVLGGSAFASLGIWLADWIFNGDLRWTLFPQLFILWGIIESIRWWRTPIVRKDEEPIEAEEGEETWPPTSK